MLRIFTLEYFNYNIVEYVHNIRKIMKRLLSILLTFIAFYNITCVGMGYGVLDQEVITGGTTEHFDLPFFFSNANYTSGGIVFTYQTDWFSQAPIVFLTISPNVSHQSNVTYTAEVSANSATQATVTVYRVTGGRVLEASSSDSINVALFAIARPSN